MTKDAEVKSYRFRAAIICGLCSESGEARVDVSKKLTDVDLAAAFNWAGGALSQSMSDLLRKHSQEKHGA